LIFAAKRVSDQFGGVAVGQVQQHRVVRGPLHQGADRGQVFAADDQIALPVAGHGPILGLGRTFGDVDHVRDPILALPDLPRGSPHRPTGP
jgi:hypothetical protein